MMLQIAFRQIESTDQAFLWEVLYHALYMPEGAAPLPREIVREPALAQYVSEWGRAGDSGLMAVDEASGTPMGAVWLRQFTQLSPAYGYLDDTTPELSIALLPEYRGRGVGTQLLERMIDQARQQHPASAALSLSVSSDNPARRLYERFGFITINTSGDSLTMRKRLSGEELLNL